MEKLTTVTTSVNTRGPLTLEQHARLAELEPIIEAGLTNFLKLGSALLEISDERLYRNTHSTFKAYVEDKWKISVRQAYRLCESAEVIKSLPPKCDQLVTTESQARELAKVPASERVKVLDKVVAKDGKVTAKAIKLEVVNPDDLPSKFKRCAVGERAARKWWYDAATPVRRGHFIELLMALSGRVEVRSMDRLRKRFEQWIKDYVTEVCP
jgi:hypothetical protein